MSGKAQKSFSYLNESINSDALLSAKHCYEVNIGRYYDDGSCEYEFVVKWFIIKWESVSTRRGGYKPKYAPVIEIWDDAFKAFKDFADLFKKLSEEYANSCVSPGDFIKLLIDLGYKDITKR